MFHASTKKNVKTEPSAAEEANSLLRITSASSRLGGDAWDVDLQMKDWEYHRSRPFSS